MPEDGRDPITMVAAFHAVPLIVPLNLLPAFGASAMLPAEVTGRSKAPLVTVRVPVPFVTDEATNENVPTIRVGETVVKLIVPALPESAVLQAPPDALTEAIAPGTVGPTPMG